MSGTNIGFNISMGDKTAARAWQAAIRKQGVSSGRSKGLAGAQLEAAVMAIAAADSSLVKIEARA